MKNYYVAGDWNVICDRCGLKKKASMLRLEWTNLRVCDDCYETRHPQTLLKVNSEQINVPWDRPQGDTIFIPNCDISSVFGSVTGSIIEQPIQISFTGIFKDVLTSSFTLRYLLGGSATPVSDYTTETWRCYSEDFVEIPGTTYTSTTVTVPSGTKYVSLILNVIDDYVPEPNKTLYMTLVNSTSNVITIVDND